MTVDGAYFVSLASTASFSLAFTQAVKPMVRAYFPKKSNLLLPVMSILGGIAFQLRMGTNLCLTLICLLRATIDGTIAGILAAGGYSLNKATKDE